MTTTTPEIDYAALSGLQTSRIASENLKNAEEMATVAASDYVSDAGEAEEVLHRLSASVGEVQRSIAELDQKMKDARRERGDALADENPSVVAIDKRIASLRSDRERAEDHLRSLLERQAAAERNALTARWHSIRERTNALNECLAKSKSEAAAHLGRLNVATATRDLLQRRAQDYLLAQEHSYARIQAHKARNPRFYPES